MKFSIKLKEFRDSLGLTQEQFAKMTGFSRTTITELEKETKKPTLKTIEKLATNTNTKISYWLDESETSDTEIKTFDGLTMVIDKLIEVGDINEHGEITDSGKALLLKMLEKEIPLYINSKKN